MSADMMSSDINGRKTVFAVEFLSLRNSLREGKLRRLIGVVSKGEKT
jgi:hypothetical protein